MVENKVGGTKKDEDRGDSFSFDSGFTWGEIKWHLKFAGRQLGSVKTWVLIALALAVIASGVHMFGAFFSGR